jgi:hypothetical protein
MRSPRTFAHFFPKTYDYMNSMQQARIVSADTVVFRPKK